MQSVSLRRFLFNIWVAKSLLKPGIPAWRRLDEMLRAEKSRTGIINIRRSPGLPIP